MKIDRVEFTVSRFELINWKRNLKCKFGEKKRNRRAQRALMLYK